MYIYVCMYPQYVWIHMKWDDQGPHMPVFTCDQGCFREVDNDGIPSSKLT